MSGEGVRGLARRLKGTPPKPSEEEAFKKLVEERQLQQVLAPIEPPPCPPGWEVGPPTFVGVGTQKSGTQWWSHHLFGHPDAVRPVRKELHFFQHGWESPFGEQGITFYHRYFPQRPGIVTGEWTPRYVMDPWTPPRLRAAAPDARLLVLLRDPMSRLRSSIQHNVVRFSPLHPRFLVESIERAVTRHSSAGSSNTFPANRFSSCSSNAAAGNPTASWRGPTSSWDSIPPSYQKTCTSPVGSAVALRSSSAGS